MKFRLKYINRAVIIGAIYASACVEPYNPPTPKSVTDFLVVEGFLDATHNTATINIKHSVPLNANEKPVAETNAVVTIVDDLDNSITLQSAGEGNYIANQITFDFNNTYHLKIRTSDAEEYISDPIAIKRTPPIDSLNWDAKNDVLNINVYTHDPSGNSKFYKWDYVETFEYNAPNYSEYVIGPDSSYYLRPDSMVIYYCWRTNNSTSINIASSDRLSEDIISHKTIRSIAGGSLLISRTYSILVQQQTLTPEAYNYWLNVEKTTESLGGLFDPLPSEVIGNIHSTTGEKKVIGYISGGEVSEKRIFIEAIEHRGLLSRYKAPTNCTGDTVKVENIPSLYYKDGLIRAVYSTKGGPPVLLGFLYTNAALCNDCRVFGHGVTQKPPFWNH